MLGQMDLRCFMKPFFYTRSNLATIAYRWQNGELWIKYNGQEMQNGPFPVIKIAQLYTVPSIFAVHWRIPETSSVSSLPELSA